MPKKIVVLYVEDDPDSVLLVTEVLAASLTPTNFVLLNNITLDAGLKCVRKDIVDIIILDLKLPDSEGLDTVIQMKNVADGKPIIVISGNVDPDVQRACYGLGVYDFFSKGDITSNFLEVTIRLAKAKYDLFKQNEAVNVKQDKVIDKQKEK